MLNRQTQVIGSMYLRSKPVLRFILDPFGRQARAFDLRVGGIAVTGGSPTWLAFDQISAAPSVRSGLMSATVVLSADPIAPVSLRAVDRLEAAAFAKATGAAWRASNHRRLEAEVARIDRLLANLSILQAPVRYPSASFLQPLLAETSDLNESLLSRLNAEAIGPDQATRLAPIIRFAANPAGARAAAIDHFVQTELVRWKDFFDTVESQPLTPEQRLSVVVDEDATLVLAGAGSGKTSVITAKAAYLIKAGIRKPDEILLLAFARDAAKEMSERIEARCGVPVEARTFHALAYDIIGSVEGKKPALAPHASDDMAFLTLIREILRDLVGTALDVAQLIIGWFAHVFDEPRSDWDFKTKHEWYSEVEKLDLRSLQGETVASFEEMHDEGTQHPSGTASGSRCDRRRHARRRRGGAGESDLFTVGGGDGAVGHARRHGAGTVRSGARPLRAVAVDRDGCLLRR